uniref:N-acetylglucosaminylphosphatidylinositol deacetylase n=1 Tax=Megaselia scalaris TaxID=36166 RepID=T1GKT6_MEGSC
ATSRRRAASSGQHQRSLIFRLLDLVRLESFKWPTNSPMERVLIITSHPDDECMFFGPVIHSIVKNLGSKIYVLCLSHGNYEKQHLKHFLPKVSSKIVKKNLKHLRFKNRVESL